MDVFKKHAVKSRATHFRVYIEIKNYREQF